MKSITVSLDDETYRLARMIAAEGDASVSGLVECVLVDSASGETEFERLRRLEQAIRESIVAFDASDRLARDEVQDRGR
jgi:hypothetical protein